MLDKLKDTDENKVELIHCESTPENHTGEIRETKPTHILIIDAVEIDEKPGTIINIKKEEIDSFNISTHSMPISFLITFLEKTMNTKILTIGIQPKQMNLTNTISQPVTEAMDELVLLIKNNL
ncbi:MAG: hydrogenase maturation protease [Methanobacteriaceae archaeon]|nr:hydrogenase maturation protease [Methanobacteriaceae archaeon]